MSRKTVRKTKMLGAGSFGEVWQGEWDGEPVAIKVSKGSTKVAVDALLREADVAVSLKGHPNVVRVLFAQETAGELQLVLEYCEDGSLLDWLRGLGKVRARAHSVRCTAHAVATVSWMSRAMWVVAVTVAVGAGVPNPLNGHCLSPHSPHSPLSLSLRRGLVAHTVLPF
jgi:hypothetical protein